MKNKPKPESRQKKSVKDVPGTRTARQTDKAQIRRKAGKIDLKSAKKSPENIESLPPDETRKLLHELRIHKIELEMQNEELRCAQEELETARARYFDLYDLAPVGYVTISEKGLFLEVNLTAANLLGVTRRSMIKQPLTRYIVKEDQDIYYLHRKQLFETGEQQKCELRMVKKDGTTFWVQLTGTLNRDTEAIPVCRVTMSDISELKRTENNLRENENKFNILSAFLPVGIYLTDPEGRCQYVNKCWCEMAGLNIEDALGTGWVHRIHPEDRVGVFSKWNQMIESGGRWEYEYRFQTREGKVTWVYGLATPQYDDAGSIVRYIGVNVDTTDRKKAEDVLRQSEENYRRSVDDLQTILDASPIMIFYKDSKNRFIRVNRALAEATGLTREEIEGKTAFEVYPNLAKNYFEQDLEVIQSGKSKMGIIEPMDTETGTRWFKTDKMPYRDINGRIIGIIGFSIDITERKQMAEALQESDGLLRGLFENMTSGAAIYKVINDGSKGSDYIIRDFNLTSLQIEGKRKDEVIGKSLLDLRPNIDQYGLIPVFQKVWRTGEPSYFPSKIYIDDKYCNWYENRIVKLSTGEVVAIYDDVTERKQAEEKLIASQQQLRALAERLQQIREEERTLISREIHDVMGGGLTGLKMDINWLIQNVNKAKSDKEQDALMSRFLSANDNIDYMIKATRVLSTGLRPPVLDDLGLIAALGWQLSDLTSRSGIPYKLTTAFEYVGMEKSKATAVFRIFQETLTNVIRHSGATKVDVVLREDDERSLFGDENLVLEIMDNGRGITKEEIQKPESLGLLGMKERAMAFGGELKIRGKSGGGTTVILKIPRKKGEQA